MFYPFRSNYCIGLFSLIVMAGALVIGGCGGASEPCSPEMLTVQDAPSNAAGHVLWGMWHVSLDPSTLEARIEPLRGVQFTCNVTRFMQPPSSPVHMIQIVVDSSSTPATGHFVVDVTLRHPFPGLNVYRGFDVRGIMMANGTQVGLHDSSVIRAAYDDTRLLNCDGYTRWWNFPEFTTYNTIFGFTHGKLAPPTHPTATVNPYKLFADGLGSQDDISTLDPNSRLTFGTTPGVNTRRYDIQFRMNSGSPVFDFNYAVDASWSEPDPAYKPEYPEEAFDLSANCNEAFMISVSDNGSTAYFVNESDKGGELRLAIEVFDHQAVSSPNGMADEVAAIWVEGEVLNEPVNVLPVATVLPGSGGQSSTYEVSLGSLNLHYSGETELFLTVESKNVTTYEPQVQGGGAFNYPDAPLAAYRTFRAVISDHSVAQPPIVTSVVPDKGATDTKINNVEVHGANFVNGATVKFVHTGSSFTIGPLTTGFVNSSLLYLNLDLTGAPLGLYDVTVTNPNLESGTLDDGFEVTDSRWWKSHMYNVINSGWNPTANLPNPGSLQQLWKNPIGGFKFTTPVVADGKIYFTTNSTYWERPDMAFYCLDAANGTLLWSKLINTSSASTGWRAFSCPVWWSGPDGVDRVAVGGDKVYCFNADTGAQLWAYDANEGGTDIGWWSNQLNEYKGKVIARSRFAYVYVLDFVTGNLVTKISTAAPAEGGCAVVDDKVYINSSYRVECADINSGAILWSTLLPGGVGNMDHWINPTIVGKRLYVTSYYSYVFCLSIANEGGYVPGQIIWSWNDTTKPLGSTSMIAGVGARVTNGVTRLYVSSSSGSSNANIYCLEDKGPNASLVWSSSVTGSFEGAAVWASAPSYPDGVVYCPDVYNGNFYAFNASNGSLLWTYFAGAVTSKCGPSIVDNYIVYCTNQDVRVLKAP